MVSFMPCWRDVLILLCAWLVELFNHYCPYQDFPIFINREHNFMKILYNIPTYSGQFKVHC